jgi:hypothetical protein
MTVEAGYGPLGLRERGNFGEGAFVLSVVRIGYVRMGVNGGVLTVPFACE